MIGLLPPKLWSVSYDLNMGKYLDREISLPAASNPATNYGPMGSGEGGKETRIRRRAGGGR